jgi:dihydrolipoamide dehydrogenase
MSDGNPMKKLSCDVAVIGAGTAGLAAFGAARRGGADALLIESGAPGTTCARSGCMPSKLLIAAAELAHCCGNASVLGIQTAPMRIDGRAVMTRLRAERNHFVRGVLKSYEAIPESQRLLGHARFVDAATLMIDDHTQVSAKAIVIATGARSEVPAMFDVVRDRVLTNDNIFELTTLPSSLAVVGAGPLGLELGQALHRLGARTTIFDQARAIGGLRNDEMNAVAAKLFSDALNLKLGAKLSVEREDGGLRMHWTSPTDSGSAYFDHVLIAAGRPPNLQELDLPRAGIVLDEHGTPQFDRATMRCGDSSIFIAGDCDHDRPLLHEAADEGAIAGSNAAAYPNVKPHPRRVPMAVTFSDPQIAVIGDVKNPQRKTGKIDFADQGRARVMNANRGLLQVYGDPDSGCLIGAEMIGPSAEHIGHLLAWSVQQQLSARSLLDMPFYHPTLEEGLRTALRDLCSQMKVAPASGDNELEYGPGV